MISIWKKTTYFIALRDKRLVSAYNSRHHNKLNMNYKSLQFVYLKVFNTYFFFLRWLSKIRNQEFRLYI